MRPEINDLNTYGTVCVRYLECSTEYYNALFVQCTGTTYTVHEFTYGMYAWYGYSTRTLCNLVPIFLHKTGNLYQNS
jgi:hypothetical protein